MCGESLCEVLPSNPESSYEPDVVPQSNPESSCAEDAAPLKSLELFGVVLRSFPELSSEPDAVPLKTLACWIVVDAALLWWKESRAEASLG